MLEQCRTTCLGESVRCPRLVEIHINRYVCNTESAHCSFNIAAHHIDCWTTDKRWRHRHMHIVVTPHINIGDNSHVDNGDCWNLGIANCQQRSIDIVRGHITTSPMDQCDTPRSFHRGAVADDLYDIPSARRDAPLLTMGSRVLMTQAAR